MPPFGTSARLAGDRRKPCDIRVVRVRKADLEHDTSDSEDGRLHRSGPVQPRRLRLARAGPSLPTRQVRPTTGDAVVVVVVVVVGLRPPQGRNDASEGTRGLDAGGD